MRQLHVDNHHLSVQVQPGRLTLTLTLKLTYHPVACSSVNAGAADFYHRLGRGVCLNRKCSPYTRKVRRCGEGTWVRAQVWWDMRNAGRRRVLKI
jgi:hypothetical protein